MIYIGLDIAKDKHDCFAMNSDGEILIEKLTFQNNIYGFNSFFNSVSQFNESFENITMHISNIYKDNELPKDSTCKKFLQVQNEGSRSVKRNIDHYNLDMIIAYRI